MYVLDGRSVTKGPNGTDGVLFENFSFTQPAAYVAGEGIGSLENLLREIMAGFDALYRNDASDAELAGISASERRVLLTRDRYLLMRTEVNRAYWVRSTDARQQVVEVLERFDLADSMRPFTRCMKSNGPLEETSVEPVLNRLPPGAARKGGIRRCTGCGSVYWKGSHYARMEKFLGWVKANAGGSPDQSVTWE